MLAQALQVLEVEGRPGVHPHAGPGRLTFGLFSRCVPLMSSGTQTLNKEKKFGAQLGNILGYIEKLKELDVANVEPTAHATPMVNVMRPDEVRPLLPHNDALRNAPTKANGLFIASKKYP